jgi:hypothetical protein
LKIDSANSLNLARKKKAAQESIESGGDLRWGSKELTLETHLQAGQLQEFQQASL